MSSSLPALPPSFRVVSTTKIASLWSNYGYIHRLTLSSDPTPLILKSIHPPTLDHPDESHLRKLLSYDIERWFYRHLATRLPSTVKLAKSYPLESDAEHSLLLEDLSPTFPHPAHGSLGHDAAISVLHWLAGFHGTFFGIHNQPKERPHLVPSPLQWTPGGSTDGVWERGTYWYLDTRRDELADTDAEEYSWLLPWVEKVNDATRREIARYGTLVHGDVKGANIVFDRDPYAHRRSKASKGSAKDASAPLRCALYDLQYVGLGLPAHDLVYFLGTSVESNLLAPGSEDALLRTYFEAFVQAMPEDHREAYPFETFMKHWEMAVVDWYRFMAGWGFWGNDRWAERKARDIVMRWEADDTEL